MGALDFMGAVTPATRAKATEVLGAAQAAGHNLTHIWGYDPNASNSEHHSGRACDFMVFRSKAAGDFIADYVWTHRARLGLIHEIWYQRIRSTVVAPGVWRAMADRGSSTNNHLDHVHVWFDSSDYRAPEAPKPASAIPAVFDSRLVVDGDLGPKTMAALRVYLNRETPAQMKVHGGPFDVWTVKHLQRFLNRHGGARLTIDGDLGPATIASLQRYLKTTTITRRLDAATVKALQRFLNNHPGKE